EGSVFVSGLKLPGAKGKDPQKLVLTSHPNLSALTRCPTAPVDVEDSARLSFSADESALSEMQKACGFDSLVLAESSPLLLSPRWQENEQRLRTLLGVQILRSSFQNGRRHLLVKEGAPRSSEILARLGELAPFYEIERFQS